MSLVLEAVVAAAAAGMVMVTVAVMAVASVAMVAEQVASAMMVGVDAVGMSAAEKEAEGRGGVLVPEAVAAAER